MGNMSKCYKCVFSQVEGRKKNGGGRCFKFYCLRNDVEGNKPSQLETAYIAITGVVCPYFKTYGG